MVSKSERRYRRHRFPIEVVEQCVWLYFRFAVSYSDIEEMMAKRGIQVTYETVREWCHKFGSLYAAQLRTKRARVGMKWHMDEVFLKMNGVQHYLWRAVDQNGAVIDILVQPRRDRWAALRFFHKLLDTAERAPRVIIADKLLSYAAAKKLIFPDVEHRQNPLSEQSSRELASANRHARKADEALSISRTRSTFSMCVRVDHAPFRLRRHLLSAARHRRLLKQAFHLWNKTAIAALLP